MALELNIPIPTSKVNRSMARFLAYMPNNLTVIDPEDETKQIPKYTDKQWYIFNLIIIMRKWDRKGKTKLAEQADETTDMFEE